MFWIINVNVKNLHTKFINNFNYFNHLNTFSYNYLVFVNNALFYDILNRNYILFRILNIKSCDMHFSWWEKSLFSVCFITSECDFLDYKNGTFCSLFSLYKNVEKKDCYLSIYWKDLFLGGHCNKISDLPLKTSDACNTT